MRELAQQAAEAFGPNGNRKRDLITPDREDRMFVHSVSVSYASKYLWAVGTREVVPLPPGNAMSAGESEVIHASI